MASPWWTALPAHTPVGCSADPVCWSAGFRLVCGSPAVLLQIGCVTCVNAYVSGGGFVWAAKLKERGINSILDHNHCQKLHCRVVKQHRIEGTTVINKNKTCVCETKSKYHPVEHVMSVWWEEPIDELTVQVWLLYHHLNFKCSLFVSGTELRTDRRTNRQTDDPITKCPRRTFQAGA